MSIQEAVTEYVKQSGTTKDAIAKQLGIGRTTLYSKMRGSQEFTISEGYKLSRIIGCTVDELYEMTKA